MNKDKVELFFDTNDEIMKVIVNDQCEFLGEYRDFNIPSDILTILKAIPSIEVIAKYINPPIEIG